MTAFLAIAGFFTALWGWYNLRNEQNLPWSGIAFLVGMGMWGWACSLYTGVSLL